MLTITLPTNAAANPPAPASPITWHGIFMDANSHDATTLAAAFDAMVPGNLTSVMFAGGSTGHLDTLLDVCDAYGVRAACGPRTEIDTVLWNPDDAPSQGELETALEPMLATLAAHPSLAFWYPLDEPGMNNPGAAEPNQRDLMDRAAMLSLAYRNVQPGSLPIVPLFIGLDRIEAGIIACEPDALLIDVYPYGMMGIVEEGVDAGPGAPEFDMTLRSFGYAFDAESYIDQSKAFLPAPIPLMLVMQAHNFFGPPADEAQWRNWGNRKPTPAEMQQQHDLAAAEGATELYWFRWESNLAPEDGEMEGLDDDTTGLLAAIIVIAQGGAPAPGGDIGGSMYLSAPLARENSYAVTETEGNESVGVPMPSIPHDTGTDAVQTWWDSHPLNPDAFSPETVIISPATFATLSSGQSLPDAIDDFIADADPAGGTIVLGAGTYTLPDLIGSLMAGKGHLHIVAPSNNATITMSGRQLVTADYWNSRYHDDEPNNGDGPSFTQGISSGVANDATEFGRNARDLVTVDRIRDIYFKGITFDGGGGPHAFDLMSAMGVLFDECTWVNGVGVTTGHAGSVNGRVALDHIYFRNCTFDGAYDHIAYLDGVWGFAAINCQYVGTYADSGWLLLCNDDFTRDYNGSGTYTYDEIRMSQFAVLYGGDTGTLVYPIQATGRDLLIDNITMLAVANTCLWWESKASYRGQAGSPLDGIVLEYQNATLRDVVNTSTRCLVHAQNTDFHPTVDEVDNPATDWRRTEPFMGGIVFINVSGSYGDDIEINGNVTP